MVAWLLEGLVSALNEAYAARKAKVCANGALLLAQLYNLGAISCNLIYDLVRRMVGAIGEDTNRGDGAEDGDGDLSENSPSAELELELLITLLRAVGAQVRYASRTVHVPLTHRPRVTDAPSTCRSFARTTPPPSKRSSSPFSKRRPPAAPRRIPGRRIRRAPKARRDSEFL